MVLVLCVTRLPPRATIITQKKGSNIYEGQVRKKLYLTFVQRGLRDLTKDPNGSDIKICSDVVTDSELKIKGRRKY